MQKKYSSSKQGFTIIEVVLVLAIAGLIFATVFIGLPALQKNQRNLQRKQAVDLVFAAVQSYYAKNHKMPYTTSESKYGKYLVDVKLDQNFVTRYVDPQCVLNWYSPSYLLTFKQCGENFTSPSGSPYKLYTKSTTEVGRINYNTYAYNGKSDGEVISIIPYSDCVPSYDDKKVRYTPNEFSIKITLEGGAEYCVDNS